MLNHLEMRMDIYRHAGIQLHDHWYSNLAFSAINPEALGKVLGTIPDHLLPLAMREVTEDPAEREEERMPLLHCAVGRGILSAFILGKLSCQIGLEWMGMTPLEYGQ